MIQFNDLTIIKDVHPGFILERELKKRHLKKGQFALSLHEYPQTLVSIIKGKRITGMNPRVNPGPKFRRRAAGYLPVRQTGLPSVKDGIVRLTNFNALRF
jgi:hypothetical protein